MDLDLFPPLDFPVSLTFLVKIPVEAKGDYIIFQNRPTVARVLRNLDWPHQLQKALLFFYRRRATSDTQHSVSWPILVADSTMHELNIVVDESTAALNVPTLGYSGGEELLGGTIDDCGGGNNDDYGDCITYLGRRAIGADLQGNDGNVHTVVLAVAPPVNADAATSSVAVEVLVDSSSVFFGALKGGVTNCNHDDDDGSTCIFDVARRRNAAGKGTARFQGTIYKALSFFRTRKSLNPLATTTAALQLIGLQTGTTTPPARISSTRWPSCPGRKLLQAANGASHGRSVARGRIWLPLCKEREQRHHSVQVKLHLVCET